MMKLKSVIRKRNKKGQIQIQDGIAVVMLIGLMFITMSVIALTGQKLGDAITQEGNTKVNESGINATGDGYELLGASDRGGTNFVVTGCVNETSLPSEIVPANNYTVNKVTGFFNGTKGSNIGALWNCTYSYSYNTASQNVTGDLEVEIGNNTSIAGIVLTISLISMILTVLIGVFAGFIRRSPGGV